MLLALGPVQLDAADAVVVVGVLQADHLGDLGATAGSSDVLWLTGAVRPEHVAAAREVVDVPVGVDVDDAGDLAELAVAGAVAAEVRSSTSAALSAALDGRLTLWCSPVDADRAVAAGIPVSNVVVEGAGGAGVPGFTQTHPGPAGWAAVFEAVSAGARVVRTTEPRSVRRVVTVTDRLLAARRTADRTVTT